MGYILGVCLGEISRESAGKGCLFVKKKKKTVVPSYRDRGYIFLPDIGGGIHVMGNEHIHDIGTA